MSIKQDVIIANQEKILAMQRSSKSLNYQPVQHKRYDQEKFYSMGIHHGMSLNSVTEGSQQHQIAHMLPVRSKEMLSTDPALRTPIIILPRTGSSVITMFNAKDILQDMTFVTTEEKEARGCPREEEILLKRTKDANFTVQYRVMDTPAILTSHEWDCVVAVFVSGQASQFEGWPWNGNPVEICSKSKSITMEQVPKASLFIIFLFFAFQVCAFHLRYNEMKLDTNVAQWPVTVLNLSRTERHLDRAVLMTFWESLDEHIARKKPELRL